MVIDGETYQIRNEYQDQIRNQYAIGDGTVVNPDGSYQTRNQQQLQLKEGECINMDGAKFMNMYQHRKMMINKNLHMKKKMNKKIKKPSMH
ncbi:MAG: hypothetical protein P8X60_00765 [Robiginitalea sp.]